MYAQRVREVLAPYANQDNAIGMRAYMREQFSFLGVKTSERRAATKELIMAWKTQPSSTMYEIVDELWEQQEREFHYVACDLLRAFKGDLDLMWLAQLVTTHSWWDSVDSLARPVGARAKANDMRAWAATDNLWLRRVSIIHQLGFKDKTDEALLAELILSATGTSEFFLNKAIGWALRDYARSNEDWVRRFILLHRDELSHLSIREATKHFTLE